MALAGFLAGSAPMDLSLATGGGPAVILALGVVTAATLFLVQREA
jgi:hypothetical protein